MEAKHHGSDQPGPPIPRGRWGALPWLALALAWSGSAPIGLAQIDPVPRRVVQAGYTQPVHEHGPLEAYGYFYYNQPGFLRTNLTLRLAVAPVYLDSELGIREFLGPYTDLGIGVAGGGFADTYSEIRRGNYYPSESFTGHSASSSVSVYHLLNPAQRAPLYAIVRGSVHRAFYEEDDATDSDFEVPNDRTTYSVRTGLRLGGREPYLTPSLAGEVSVWYEGRFRRDVHAYGYDNQRNFHENTHRFWARALLAYTFEESQRFMEVSLTTGTTLNADRFSAYRLGGSLPLIAEFPLTLPGYYREEISARQFLQLSSSVLIPLDPAKRWALGAYGGLAWVDYLNGLSQPGDLNSGVGTGLIYRSPSRAWTFGTAYSYGINAIREHGRGAHSISAVMQYDLDALAKSGNRPFWDPLLSANTWRGVLGIFRGK